jgi:hypothetical protein
MAEQPIVMSEEPEQVRINVVDPTKPQPQKPVITTAKKVPKKPGVKDKVIGAFFGNEVNSENLGDHLLNDYAVPAGKRMLNNAAQGILKGLGNGVQMLLFGKVVNQIGGPTDYTSFSNPNSVTKAPAAHKLMDQVETFAFGSREDAFNMLNYLKGRIVQFGSVSVLDYYEAMNEPVDYMMANRGWTDLSTATVNVAPEGFIIVFPRPIALTRG